MSGLPPTDRTPIVSIYFSITMVSLFVSESSQLFYFYFYFNLSDNSFSLLQRQPQSWVWSFWGYIIRCFTQVQSLLYNLNVYLMNGIYFRFVVTVSYETNSFPKFLSAFLTIVVWPLTMIFLGAARKPSATKSAKSCQSTCFPHKVQVQELQLLKNLDKKLFYICKRCK